MRGKRRPDAWRCPRFRRSSRQYYGQYTREALAELKLLRNVFRPSCRSQVSATAGVVKGKPSRSRHTETAYRMKLNAQQRTERLHLYGLVQSLSYVVRLNDLKTAQHFRARLAWVLRKPSDLAKPLRDDLKELLAISGLWLRNIGDRHGTKQQIQRVIRRIVPRLNVRSRGEVRARSSENPMRQSLDHAAQAADRGEPQPHHRRRRG